VGEKQEAAIGRTEKAEDETRAREGNMFGRASVAARRKTD